MTDWCDVHTRIPVTLKEQAEKVLARMGMTLSDSFSRYLAELTLEDEEDYSPFQIDPSHPGFEAWKRDLNRKIEEAEEDFTAGRFLTAEEFKADMEAFITSRFPA